jgi:hypothetical protein
MSSDSTEIYYAEMEAARNSAWDAYQVARPHLLRSDHAREFQTLFHAGFERAFALLFHGGRAAPETQSAPEASIMKAFQRSPRRVSEERWDDSQDLADRDRE